MTDQAIDVLKVLLLGKCRVIRPFADADMAA
jgi:hypothetical protein